MTQSRFDAIRGELYMQGIREFVADLPRGLVMAEIGCYTGLATREFIEKSVLLYAVDVWSDIDCGNIAYSEMAEVEAVFDERLHGFAYLRKMKMTSEQAAAAIPDGSLDLVYIDANHTYEAVKRDIEVWLPKLKPTGMMSGHDYETVTNPGVPQAVNEIFGQPDKVYCDFSWVVFNPFAKRAA